MGAPKRTAPERPALFDEVALREFIGSANWKPSSGCATPRHAVPFIYRAAVRSLREIKEDPEANLEDNVNAWREGTRKKLAKQKALPDGLADAIASEVDFLTTKLVSNADGGDGGTSKLLLQTHDGHQVEAVVIRRHGRATTICVSSQVGCQMGCQFCATGTMGILGDLTSAEILEQVVYSKLAPSKLRQVPLKNIVFMGMGEPMNNFEQVKAAVLGLTDSNMFGMGRAHITVSTVGVVPYMKRLTAELPGVPLALSLHAPNQSLRERIVPVASKAWPLPKLIAALDEHIALAQAEDKAGGRKFTGVMVEYVLLAGVNDSLENARELADLLGGRPVLINLIPYNPNVTADMYGFTGPTEAAGRAFGRVLVERGLYARLRIERGGDIGAACGQLALTSTTAAKKMYQGAANETAEVDIEELGNRSAARLRAPVQQPGGAAAVDKWRKRTVSKRQPAQSASNDNEQCLETRPPSWTPPDGFLNMAEVRQLMSQLSLSNSEQPPTLPAMTDSEKVLLRNEMMEMDPEGEGEKVSVAAFAAWWSERQQSQSVARGELGIATSCVAQGCNPLLIPVAIGAALGVARVVHRFSHQ